MAAGEIGAIHAAGSSGKCKEPTITSEPQNQSVVTNFNATFSVMASGLPSLTYQWEKDGVGLLDTGRVTGASSPTLSIAGVQPGDVGNYRVVVSNKLGMATSAVATLTLLLPPTISVGPVSQNLYAASDGALQVNATGAMPLGYQWYFNDQVLEGATNNLLTLSNVTPAQVGNYRVVVSNWLGSVTSAVASVMVQTVVAWGDNRANACSPPQNLLTNVVKVAGEYYNGFALNGDGAVVSWVANFIFHPWTDVAGMSSGELHTLVINSNGTVSGWGYNDYSQCFPPPGLSNVVEVAAGSASSLALKSDGTLVGWGLNDSGQTQIPEGLINVIAIACGGSHSLALQVDGTVRAWGVNAAGQTNVPGDLTNVIAIAAGKNHSLALKSDGTVVAWGDNTSNQLAVPFGLTNGVAIAAGYNHTIALKSDGTVVTWGGNEYGACEVPPGLSHVMSVAAGLAYRCSVIVGRRPPEILRSPVGGVVVEGRNHLFKCPVAGTVPLHYQWRWNGTNLPGATAPTLMLPNLQFGQAGEYSLEVSNSLGVVTSAVAVLNVVLRMPAIVEQPQSQSQPIGGNASFAVSSTGIEPLFYQWQFNGDALPNATNSTLQLANLQATNAGAYSVIITNAFGSATSQPAALTILPTAPFFLTQPVGQTVLAGTNITFSASANGTEPLNYQWFFNDTALVDNESLTGSLTASLSITGAQANDSGSYQLVVSNVVGVATSSIVNLSVLLPVSFVQQPLSQNAILGSNVTFSAVVAGSDPINYQWFRNGSPLSDGGRISGVHSNLLGISGLLSSDAGNYSVIVNNPLSSATSIAAILGVGTPPVITSASTNKTVPAGTNVTLSVTATGTAPLVYQWSFNQTNLPGATNTSLNLTNVQAEVAGVYQIRVTNSFGWVFSADAILTVEPSAWISLQPTSRVVSVGQTVVFSAAAKGTEPIFCLWQKDGSDLLNATNLTLTLSNVNASLAGTYRAVFTNAAGVILSTNATLSVVPVIVWGLTNYVQMKLSATVPSGATNVVAIAAGRTSYSLPCLALRADGSLVGWGYSDREPGILASATNVMAIAVGGGVLDQGPCHTLALRKDGTVVAWGNNNYGQTNVPARVTNVVAIAAGGYHNLALRTDGTVVAWGLGRDGQTNVPPSATNVVALAAGGNHSLALRADGTVVGWGMNNYGQATNLVNATNIIAIAAGGNQSLALRADGTMLGVVVTNDTNNIKLVMWGAPPANATNLVAISAGTQHSLGLRADGTVVGWGYNIYGQATPPALATNVIAISAGGYHSLALVSDPTLPVLPAVEPLPTIGAFKCGSDIMLRVIANGGLLTYQWQCNGTNVPGATANFLMLRSTAANQTGRYSVLVSNTAGMVRSSETLLVVWPELSLKQIGDECVAGWEGPFVLQSSTNVLGPYIDVPDAINSFTNSLNDMSEQYFRLRY